MCGFRFRVRDRVIQQNDLVGMNERILIPIKSIKAKIRFTQTLYLLVSHYMQMSYEILLLEVRT